MAELFCCLAIKPYRPQRLDHEAKFDRFMQWAKHASSVPSDSFHINSNLEYAVQLVKQVNFGPQESIRYFAPANSDSGFIEITENNLLEANFEKLNSFKNFKCGSHNKFFEVNLYQKNPINRHHWRANLARPSTDIDLSLKQKAEEKSSDIRAESSTSPPGPTSGESGSTSPKAELQAEENTNKIESTAVKSALRILLPTVKTNLGPKPLASLLCLDWVNEQLGLGLNLEKDWQTQLTSRNIATFIFDYSRLSSVGSVTLAEIENLVALAMHRNSSSENCQLQSGRKQFQEIVDQVLEARATSSWVFKSREAMMRTFTTGPNEELLKLFQHNDEEEQMSSLTDKFRLNVDDENGDDDSQYDDDTNRYEEYYDDDVGSYSSDFEDKDLTACDKECGYCGRCPY
ncbi:hypothetical protein TGAM01_v209923 [Trichoderma gamsii]|uniref:Uncharacterized protein n=1 Tax=Trichoderma gamsii TaxID=398673 RepID=A0A2P4ZA86_9HYPO|nr:hypothetical protein TGAM01_v209923 [Trichoderma gamsii]PON21197.1 hypothetical protein TGAM01_v209923 [Trichoderma gamsii]